MSQLYVGPVQAPGEQLQITGVQSGIIPQRSKQKLSVELYMSWIESCSQASVLPLVLVREIISSSA
ncbi:hypothetical protein CCM_04835 [Cordyceps militaris CM01]|uniref:Uncharacterized protein n=1 Tax=Cordyceps militaris (strain CM01) TaxID=983644 RepID=G3JEW8_CORMM|nr:uncharacterized protein CCM_04835 [Cordyceps militaris CM01]EGX93461.1 hypothetical protein CCM_04835 [Cordyceps militaris CM01]